MSTDSNPVPQENSSPLFKTKTPGHCQYCSPGKAPSTVPREKESWALPAELPVSVTAESSVWGCFPPGVPFSDAHSGLFIPTRNTSHLLGNAGTYKVHSVI